MREHSQQRPTGSGRGRATGWWAKVRRLVGVRTGRTPPPRTPPPVPGDEPDFASEHQDFTVDKGDRDGPEGAPNRDSPKGYRGMD